jgi:hypothetical protein
MEENTKENTMCSRAEVEHIVERSTKEVKDAVRDLKSEHTAWQEKLNNGFDKRIAEIATAIVKNEKDSMVRFIGWGGIGTGIPYSAASTTWVPKIIFIT